MSSVHPLSDAAALLTPRMEEMSLRIGNGEPRCFACAIAVNPQKALQVPAEKYSKPRWLCRGCLVQIVTLAATGGMLVADIRFVVPDMEEASADQ